MRIDKTDNIAGIPIIEVRDVLGRVGDLFYADDLKYKFALSDRAFKGFFKELIKRDFIKASLEYKCFWELTIKGCAFTMASAAKPIKRVTADRLIKEFIDRIDIVNNDSDYLYKVKTAVIFGSYLSDKDKINDIDIAIQLERVEKDPEKYRILLREQVIEEDIKGRVFREPLDFLLWPEKKVRLFIKSRSRALSLHRMEDLNIVTGGKKVIFGAWEITK